MGSIPITVELDGQSLYASSLYQPGAYRLDLANTAAGWAAVPGVDQWGYRAFAFTDCGRT